MIREALEYVVALRKREAFAEIDGKKYVLDGEGTISQTMDGFLETEARAARLKELKEPPAMEVTTLSSIIEYVNDDPEGFFHRRELLPVIHIKSPTKVALYASLDEFTRRIPIMTASAITPEIKLERPMDTETFIIMLQSCFAETEDRDRLLRLASKITAEASQTLKDDGVSQTVEVRKGVATKGEERIENPVYLAPFRTFIEVEQPSSGYVFRIHDGPTVALYGAGGAEWQIMAMEAIKSFIEASIGHGRCVTRGVSIIA